MSTEQEFMRELLVWGYIRNLESQYQIENIPVDINNIILLFQRFVIYGIDNIQAQIFKLMGMDQCSLL